MCLCVCLCVVVYMTACVSFDLSSYIDVIPCEPFQKSDSLFSRFQRMYVIKQA